MASLKTRTPLAPRDNVTPSALKTKPGKSTEDAAEREKVRDFVLELSMNSSVQQALPTDELRLLFKEADDVRETVARGGAMRDELFQLVQAAVRQVTG